MNDTIINNIIATNFLLNDKIFNMIQNNILFYENLYNFIKHIEKHDKYTKHFNFYIHNNYVNNKGIIEFNHNNNKTPDIDFYLFNNNNIYNDDNNCNNIKLDGLFENISNDKLQIFIYYEKLLNNTYKYISSDIKLYDNNYYYYMVIEKKKIIN